MLRWSVEIATETLLQECGLHSATQCVVLGSLQGLKCKVSYCRIILEEFVKSLGIVNCHLIVCVKEKYACMQFGRFNPDQ